MAIAIEEIIFIRRRLSTTEQTSLHNYLKVMGLDGVILETYGRHWTDAERDGW